MKKEILIQQGDVLFISIDGIPNTTNLKKNNHVAEGEVTGHYHEVVGDNIAVLESPEGLYVDVPKGGKCVHQEHKPVILPSGKFKIRIVQEYNHFAEEAKNVQD